MKSQREVRLENFALWLPGMTPLDVADLLDVIGTYLHARNLPASLPAFLAAENIRTSPAALTEELIERYREGGQPARY